MRTATELKKELDALQEEQTKFYLKKEQLEQELQSLNSKDLISFIVNKAVLRVTLGTFNVQCDDSYREFVEIVRNIGPFNSHHWDTPLSDSIIFRHDDGVSQIYYSYNDPEQRESKDENYAINKVFAFLQSINFPKDKINFDDVDSEINGALRVYENRKQEKERLVSAFERAYR